MAFKDFLVNTLLPTFSAMGQVKLVELLDDIEEKEPETHEKIMQLGTALCDLLVPFVEKTKTKIDDTFVEGLQGALEQSKND